MGNPNPSMVRPMGLGHPSPRTPISGGGDGVSETQSWVDIVESETKREPQSFAAVVSKGDKPLRNREISNGMMLEKTDRRDEEISITMDDVEDEIKYWNNAMIGYVVGEQVPFSAVEGFLSLL
ncbi:hypothetical protein Droror1_Dr00017603 [Drosera rotundifolia]